MLSPVVARSFSGNFAIRYVGPTSGFVDDVTFSYSGPYGDVTQPHQPPITPQLRGVGCFLSYVSYLILLLLLPFINTIDKTQLHTQNGNSRSHKIQQPVFTHNSLSINNLVCYS